MTCADVRADLPAYLHGDLDKQAAGRLETHLAACPACRREREAFDQLGRLLDAVPAPAVQVDLPRLYRAAAEWQWRRARRWRRVAAAVGAAAAALLVVAFGLRLEVRADGHQLTLRWGAPPAPAPAPAPPPAVAPEQLQVLSELIHALATDVDARDRRQADELVRLQGRLNDLQRLTARRQAELERALAAVYASSTLARRGENE
jgi:anti-sigma factor RsiW